MGITHTATNRLGLLDTVIKLLVSLCYRFRPDINKPIATAATVSNPVPTPTPISPSFTIASSTADFNSAP